jgi:hypothetical protein
MHDYSWLSAREEGPGAALRSWGLAAALILGFWSFMAVAEGFAAMPLDFAQALS